MPKIKEELLYDNQADKLIVKKTFDNRPELDRVAEISKDSSVNKFGSDFKFVGSVPMNVLNEWLKEAGVAWSDTHAVQEIMKRKLKLRDYGNLKAWKGNY